MKMHARHRRPGNGYRSSSIGMGGLAPSRISPESSRGHGMYSSDYRNNNRGGFVRGQQKQYQPPLPPPVRRGDVFMEAGRLATEYLVSRGVFPPVALSGKWENGNLQSQVEDFQGFRPHEGDSSQFPRESQTPAIARLGDAISDAGAGKRRFPDEFNTSGLRDYRRRRMGSFKDYGPELKREMGRSRSWSEKARAYGDKEGDDDAFMAPKEEQRVSKVSSSVEQNLQPTELPSKVDDAGCSKASPPTTEKDIPAVPNLKFTDSASSKEITNVVVGDVTAMKDDVRNDATEKQSSLIDITIIKNSAEVVDLVSKNTNDLLRDCKFVKVPTRIRSSLTTRGSRIDPVLITEDENAHGDELAKESGASLNDVSVEGSSDAPTHQNVKLVEAESSKVSAQEDVRELTLPYTVKQENTVRSLSATERTFMSEQGSSDASPGFGGWSSMIMEKSEKPPAEDVDNKEPVQNLVLADQNNSMDTFPYQESGVEQHVEYAEEKQLFPGSFKLCDLNLMEASEVNESHDADSVVMFPSISLSKNEAAPVNIGLSMSSSSCDMSDKYGRHGVDGKDVEVIDLESNLLQQDKDFNNHDRKDETVFTGLESFPSHAQTVNDIPDVQDGYGLMISELLGNDIPNCTSVTPDVNSLQNEMGIHNGEGILGDDDLIYMSLGEIPISMPEILFKWLFAGLGSAANTGIWKTLLKSVVFRSRLNLFFGMFSVKHCDR